MGSSIHGIKNVDLNSSINDRDSDEDEEDKYK
jgi:hypothetical protein